LNPKGVHKVASYCAAREARRWFKQNDRKMDRRTPDKDFGWVWLL